MARLSSRQIGRYRKAVDDQADLARAYVQRALDTYFEQNPGCSTADGRAFAIELLKASMPNFCDAAGTLAADFFDEVCASEGIEAESQLYDTTDYSKVEDKVRYFADKLNGGDVDAFKREVVDATHYFVKRSAYDNMVENCRVNAVRYARVPSGFETCAFCFMLASRGFVYHSEATAKGLHGYHDNCDCCIVPGAKGRTRIEGYDPEGMYERWYRCVEAIGGEKRIEEEWEALPDIKRQEWISRHLSEAGYESPEAAKRAFVNSRINREVESRDWEWLYTGTCRNTRLAANPNAARFKRDMPEVYEAWQESVSRICGDRRNPPGLKLSQEQRSHIYGTAHYERRLGPDPNNPSKQRGPSFFIDEEGQPWPAGDALESTLDQIWNLIKDQAGRGVPQLNKYLSGWNGEEDIDYDRIIGIDGWSGAKVSGLTVKFGSSSVHVYPTFGRI